MAETKKLYIEILVAHLITMAEKEKSGFQSSAGLIRYFDSEDEKSVKFSPYLVIGFAIATIIVVSALEYIWPA